MSEWHTYLVAIDGRFHQLVPQQRQRETSMIQQEKQDLREILKKGMRCIRRQRNISNIVLKEVKTYRHNMMIWELEQEEEKLYNINQGRIHAKPIHHPE